MLKRNLKQRLKSKEFKILFFLSLSVYMVLYFLIKNEFFYNAVQYNLTYINYYINKYLSGNVSDIIFNDSIYMFVESDVKNIFSSLYIYVISFNNILFVLFSISLSIMIHHIILSKFHCDIFKKFSIPKITRIGVRKYVKNEIVTNCIYFGLILMLPRLCYFLILSFVFPVGISTSHFISSMSVISDNFFYLGYDCSPYLMIILDLIISFLYGVILSLISMTVVACSKNKALSYLIYIFILIFLSFTPWYFNEAPIMYYSSIYQYFSFFYENSNVFKPLIIISIFSLLVGCISNVIVKKKVVDSI